MPHEEEILRHPFQLTCWTRYIEHKRSAPKAVINLLYERALKELPGRSENEWGLIVIVSVCVCKSVSE